MNLEVDKKYDVVYESKRVFFGYVFCKPVDARGWKHFFISMFLELHMIWCYDYTYEH